MPSPYPAARIAVEDSAWRAFRQAAIVRGIPVSVYLGKLVEAELGRRSETQVGGVDAEAGPRDQAVTHARQNAGFCRGRVGSPGLTNRLRPSDFKHSGVVESDIG
jgi:hypothetical protein